MLEADPTNARAYNNTTSVISTPAPRQSPVVPPRRHRSHSPHAAMTTGAKHKSDDPGDDGPITPATQPPKATGNPLEGVKLWVDPNSNAMLRANSIRAKEPEKK